MALHPRVSVHSICFAGRDMDGLFRAWGEIGAQRISFDSAQVLRHGAPAVRALAEAGGHAVETMTHVFSPGPLGGDLSTEQDGLARAIDAAATLGARSIYMLSGGRGAMDWDEGAAGFAEAIAPGVAQARAAGVALAIENAAPLYADLHLATNLGDTIALAEQAGIGVCIDGFACWTEARLGALIARAARRLVLVQVSDHVPGDRAMPCRAVPGDGAIPWRTLLRRFAEVGYAGTFDLELIGPRIDSEGQVAAVTRAAAHLGVLLEAG